MANDSSNPLQASASWLEERTGCATASRMNDILDFQKSGKPGSKRIQYMKEILAERMTGNAMRHFVTQAMQDGLDREPVARAEYEAKTGNLVSLAGFIPHPSIEFSGCSPDGLVEDDGLIEIKAPTDSKYVDWLLAGVVPDEHKAQMTFQLACTGRQWVDFCAYSPNVKDPKKRLFVRRFEPSKEEVSALEDEVRKFLEEVQAMFDQLNSMEFV